MAKEYELVGGQPVKVVPLDANEEGEYRAPLGQAYNPVKVGSTGGGLPPVTSDDNGDVLTVVDGAWDKAAPSGSGGNYLNKTDTDFIIENGASLSATVLDNDGVQLYIRWQASDNPAWENLYKSTVDGFNTIGLKEIKINGVAFPIQNNEGDYGRIVNNGVPTLAYVGVTLSGTKRYITIYEDITESDTFLPEVGTTLALDGLVYEKLSADPEFERAVHFVMGY